jgi:hypothetical protein
MIPLMGYVPWHDQKAISTNGFFSNSPAPYCPSCGGKVLAHDNLIDRIYVCMALSKIAVCFMTANGRGIDVAKRLLE